MTLRAHASGALAAVLLPLGTPMAAPVAAEPAAASSAEASSPPGVERPTPAVPVPAPELARRHVRRRTGRTDIVGPLQMLVSGLKLDRAQEAEVRKALKARAEAIRRLALAPSDPEVPRVASIHAIARRTSERIRAVLNDEQKRLYGQPLPQELVAGEGKPGVEEWLGALQGQGKGD